MVFAIVGISGNVGGSTAEFLLQHGAKIRAIVRSEAKGESWKAKGAEIAVADFEDTAALEKAFTGVEGVFLLIPPEFQSQDGYALNFKVVNAFVHAIQAAKVPKVVYLSSFGAHLSSGTGVIRKVYDLEQALFKLHIPTASLRAALFFENSFIMLPLAQQRGEILAFYDPAYSFPMVATADIGRAAAETLLQSWVGHRIIAVVGPRDYSTNDIAAILSTVLEKEVKSSLVPSEKVLDFYKSHGFSENGATLMSETYTALRNKYIRYDDEKETFRGTTTAEDFYKNTVKKLASV